MADVNPQLQNPDGASVPIPSDKEIAYTVNSHGKPSLAYPRPDLPGHTNQADGEQVRAQAAARHRANVASAQSKHDEQFRADTRSAVPQHYTPSVRRSTPTRRTK